MFPKGHAIFGKKCYRKKDPFRIIGSVISDGGWNDKITEMKMHNCDGLTEYVEECNPKYTIVAVAMIMHNEIDDLAEVSYNGGTGYVKQGWETLAKFLPDSAHCAPELEFDLFISPKQPRIIEKALYQIKKSDLVELTDILSGFYNEKSEFFLNYLDWLVLYEKGIDYAGKKAKGIYEFIERKDHKKFYKDTLKTLKKEYLKELHRAYSHGKRATKRAARHPVLSSG